MSETLTIAMPGPLACIGDALIERLKIGFPVAKFEHAFLPAKLDGATWTRLLRRTPFVGVGFVDIENHNGSGQTFTGHSAWAVFLVSKNENGPKARFFGDKLAPGVLQMTEVAFALLHGFTIKGLGSVQVTKADNSYAEEWKDEALAAVLLSASVSTSFSASDVLDGITPLTIAGTTAQWTFDGRIDVVNDATTGGI